MSPTSPSAVRAEPNVAPMIDVMLVLLVIFMIVVPAMAAGTPAVPPQGMNLKAHPEEAGDQTLAIDRAGRYYLNKRPISREELPAALHAIFAARAQDHILYLTADRNLEYETVRDAIDVASASRVRVVGMITEKPPHEP
jgi:biopolymer transport protein ExbD